MLTTTNTPVTTSSTPSIISTVQEFVSTVKDSDISVDWDSLSTSSSSASLITQLTNTTSTYQQAATTLLSSSSSSQALETSRTTLSDTCSSGSLTINTTCGSEYTYSANELGQLVANWSASSSCLSDCALDASAANSANMMGAIYISDASAAVANQAPSCALNLI